MEVVNIPEWLSANKDSFLPPVCNKLLHNQQLVVMFVGGPNTRADFHIEEGEEFFYMVRGDMVLKIVERGRRRDVVIREGESFLLPARIPHSPQRNAHTVGLVIERRRREDETDVLRYYQGDSLEPLYEKAFHSVDLGTELPPIIRQYFASVEYKTGRPSTDSVLKQLPFDIDGEREMPPVTSLSDALRGAGDGQPLFAGEFQFDIRVRRGAGESRGVRTGGTDHWLWQMEGASEVGVAGGAWHVLGEGDSLLLPPGIEYSWKRREGCVALSFLQMK